MASGTGIRLEIERGVADLGQGMPIHEAEHPATLLALVEAGVGVAPLPSLAWPEASHPVLTWRKLVAPVIERELYLIWRIGRDLSPAARAPARHSFRGSGDLRAYGLRLMTVTNNIGRRSSFLHGNRRIQRG